MRVTWETDDASGGDVVAHRGDGEHYIVGYLAAESSNARYTLTSLRDGMVNGPRTPMELAIELNRRTLLPVGGKRDIAEAWFRAGLKA